MPDYLPVLGGANIASDWSARGVGWKVFRAEQIALKNLPKNGRVYHHLINAIPFAPSLANRKATSTYEMNIQPRTDPLLTHRNNPHVQDVMNKKCRFTRKSSHIF